MKTCLTRERGTGRRSQGEDEHCWTFVNMEKHTKNVFESDRSQLLSGVIKKSYFSIEDISRVWRMRPMPSTEHTMGYLPISKHQTCSKRAKPCQDSTVIQGCLKTNFRLKLRPDGAVTQESSWPLERPCSCLSEGAKPCQDSTVTQEHLSMNIDTEKKLKTSSVKHLDNCLELDLPGPSMKEPNWRVGTPDMCQEGTQKLRWSTMNVGNERKHQFSSYSPRD